MGKNQFCNIPHVQMINQFRHNCDVTFITSEANYIKIKSTIIIITNNSVNIIANVIKLNVVSNEVNSLKRDI